LTDDPEHAKRADEQDPSTPFSQLEAPGDSSSGLTGEERRRIFLDEKAVDRTILDPFAGSGTTLVEASVLGIHALGIELSPFNCLIVQAKTRRHHLRSLRRGQERVVRVGRRQNTVV